MKKWLKFSIIFFVFITLDIFIKYYVHNHVGKINSCFYPYGGIGIFKNFWGISFSINYVENTGAAWGLFARFSKLLFVFRIVILLGLFVYLIGFCKDKKKEMPLFFILTGASGNILDFCFYKKVIDMFHFKFWGYEYPIFNLADCLITIGISLLFLIFVIEKFQRRKSYEN